MATSAVSSHEVYICRYLGSTVGAASSQQGESASPICIPRPHWEEWNPTTPLTQHPCL